MSAAGDAALAASLFAVDPRGLGGVCLRSLVQPARDQWLQLLRDLTPSAVPLRRIPFNISDDRLLGGLDLAATLKANRPVADRGALAAADGGIVIVTMAERLSPHTTACLDSVLDGGEVSMAREGVVIHDCARVGVVALDESMADDEHVPLALLDRLAFLVDLNGFDLRTPLLPSHDAADIAAAAELLPRVTMPEELLSALCATGMALGAGSLRISLLAMRAAKTAAALDGRATVSEDDAAAAGRLVFAPRATQLPRPQPDPKTPPQALDDATPDPPAEPPSSAAQPAQADGPPSEAAAPPAPSGPDEPQAPAPDEPAADEPAPDAHSREGKLDEVLLESTQAAIPRGLLERLRAVDLARSSPTAAAGRAGAVLKGGMRGRPSGVRSAVPRGGERLNVSETLRAAAPWQRLRGRAAQGDSRVRVAPADLRVTQYQRRSPTLTIFAVDASGSSALNRLAEAKGAVELLLADCYVRRDQVAVITFRGRSAEQLLPPTRSLVRAKKNLAGLPGGGGTPLAAAIDMALHVAEQSLRRGETPILVLLTDGRANVARDGSGGRDGAHADALQAARRLRLARVSTLFIDTSPRPNPLAESLALAMNAEYIPLPYANAQSLSRVVGAAAARAPR